VCNPAGKKEGNIGAGEISGIKLESSGMHEVARVIKHHHYHDKAAQQIDRVDPTYYSGPAESLMFHSV
jgi:hypothetical protein